MASYSLQTAPKSRSDPNFSYSKNHVSLPSDHMRNRDSWKGLKRETLVDNPSKCLAEYKNFVAILLSFIQ